MHQCQSLARSCPVSATWRIRLLNDQTTFRLKYDVQPMLVTEASETRLLPCDAMLAR